MFKSSYLVSALSKIEEAIDLILLQRPSIVSADYFTSTQQGMFVLGGICMQLVYIGETVKVIDKKTGGEYLNRYPEVPWVEIMGLRNLLAHEYHKVDEEEIFSIIQSDLDDLRATVQRMKKDMDVSL